MTVSVVVTAYNVEKYLRRCLDSILTQTWSDIELIVVEDCSTDGTKAVLAEYENRAGIIWHQKNKGAGWSRRDGIEAATGDYVITVDADDWLSPAFIETLALAAMETEADIVSGGLTVVYPDGYEEIKRFRPSISEGMRKFEDYAHQRTIFLNNKIVRRGMYDKVPYCTRRYCEDTPVIIPMLYHANKVAYADTQGYFYLQHDQSLCHRVTFFEQALYKALCSVECMAFFADKGDEYKGLISEAELVRYIKVIKQGLTPELAEQYREELGQLAPVILRMIEL